MWVFVRQLAAQFPLHDVKLPAKVLDSDYEGIGGVEVGALGVAVFLTSQFSMTRRIRD